MTFCKGCRFVQRESDGLVNGMPWCFASPEESPHPVFGNDLRYRLAQSVNSNLDCPKFEPLKPKEKAVPQ